MDSRAARDERNARAQIEAALVEASDPNDPITTISDFLNLLRESYLASKIYERFEKIAVELWMQRPIANPLTPDPSIAHNSPESKAGDVLGDNLDDLPSLEAVVEIDSVWIMKPARAEFAHAAYKLYSKTGSYIRAEWMQNNDMGAGDDGFVAIRWSQHGFSNNSGDNARPPTACRIVNEEEAKSMGMNADLVLGTDCRGKLHQQAFGIHVIPKASRRIVDFMNEGAQTPASPASLPSSNQQRRAAPSEVPIQIVMNFNGPTTINYGGLDPAAALSRNPLPAFLGPGMAEMAVPETPEGSRKKRKMSEEHELRSRDRAGMLQD